MAISILAIYVISALFLFVIQCVRRTHYTDGEWVIVWTPVVNTIIALVIITMWIMYLIDKIRE